MVNRQRVAADDGKARKPRPGAGLLGQPTTPDVLDFWSGNHFAALISHTIQPSVKINTYRPSYLA